METELDYYTRKVAEELRAAASATSTEAQLKHRRRAEDFAVLVQEQANRPDAVGF